MPKNEKILNLFCLVFCGFFTAFIFSVSTSNQANSQQFRVKSHLQFNENFSGKTFVLDGDSLKVGSNEVRLFGLDAPEYSQKCFNEKDVEYPCGQISRDFLIKLVGGKNVTCYFAQKDKYDRYLGKCYVGKVSINQEIVKNGMGVIYNFTESGEEMDRLEAEAKEKKLGIWRGKFQRPKDYRKDNPRIN